jgi:hypothetical protein
LVGALNGAFDHGRAPQGVGHLTFFRDASCKQRDRNRHRRHRVSEGQEEGRVKVRVILNDWVKRHQRTLRKRSWLFHGLLLFHGLFGRRLLLGRGLFRGRLLLCRRLFSGRLLCRGLFSGRLLLQHRACWDGSSRGHQKGKGCHNKERTGHHDGFFDVNKM